LITVASLALVAGGAAACHNTKAAADTATGPLPAAGDLMNQAGTAMGTVKTVKFAINVDGSVPGLPLHSADGVLTKAGDAKGSASISELGATIQVDFVIVGQSFYLKALTGGYQKLPLSTATAIYDPSAILDPKRGISKLLSGATDPKTVGSESINGHNAYKVALKLDPAAIESLIPGAGAGTTGTVWIDATSHRVDKGVFTLPTTGGKSATVTITLTDYDAPVTISAP
jgi:lipoprotein LprG